MKRKTPLYLLLATISALTILTGLVQMLVPGMVLRLMLSEATPTAKHFFGIVGMFMVLFGGALLHALLSPAHQPVVVLWAGLQKFGASLAVGLGVLNAVFSSLALLVAGFDLLSGILIFLYWSEVRRQG